VTRVERWNWQWSLALTWDTIDGGEEPDRRFDIGAGRMGISSRVWLGNEYPTIIFRQGRQTLPVLFLVVGGKVVGYGPLINPLSQRWVS